MNFGNGIAMQEDRKQKSGLRGVTRLYAIQVLYQSQFEEQSLEKLLSEAKNHPEIVLSEDIALNEIDFEFFENLMKKLQNNLGRIDDCISKNVAKNWSFSRLDKVMQSLLRLGTCEILFFKEIPSKVIFNEYIEIAKSFFAKNDVSFVNGILNSIYKQEKIEA